MKRAVVLVVACTAAVAACTGDGEPAQESAEDGPVIVTQPSTATTDGGARTTDSPTTTAAAPPSSGRTPSPTTGTPATTAPPTTAPPPPPTTTAPVVGDPVVASELVVEVDRPVDLAVRPGDPALYLVGQRGAVTRFDPATGATTTVVDLGERITTAGNEQGLLGLEFSPDGALAYVNFTAGNGDTTIVEFSVGPDGAFDTATERLILTVDQPYGNHNAGDLAFGPDGYLYIPLGDGGSGGDPERRASDPTSFLGSLLRIDPGSPGELPYAIPPDNPFAAGPRGDVEGAPEVWAWGLRNPWRIAFDPVTTELWIADVGQNAHEEVNLVGPTGDAAPAFAANFGWSAFEGTERFNDDVPDPGDTVMPVLTYPHSSGGCSVSGGAPYRGSAIAELAPAYVYSDYCLGTIWALDLAGQRNLVLLDGFSEVTAVRPGPDGELYVLERSGRVHRLTPP